MNKEYETRKTRYSFPFIFCFATVLSFFGCASRREAHLVVVNERLGYVKALNAHDSAALRTSIAKAEVMPNIKSFSDLHGGGYWGGRMYDVYVPIRKNIFVKMFIFDSSAGLVEEISEKGKPYQVRSLEGGPYRILTPWKDEQEEYQADSNPDNLQWGLFPKQPQARATN